MWHVCKRARDINFSNKQVLKTTTDKQFRLVYTFTSHQQDISNTTIHNNSVKLFRYFVVRLRKLRDKTVTMSTVTLTAACLISLQSERYWGGIQWPWRGHPGQRLRPSSAPRRVVDEYVWTTSAWISRRRSAKQPRVSERPPVAL